MDLKYSGLLFVFFVILEARNGLALNNTSSHTQDLPALIQPTVGKSQTGNETTAESVTIIIPNSAGNISPLKSDSKANGTTGDKTTVEPPTSKIPIPTTAPTPAPAPALSTNTAPAPSPSPSPDPEKGSWIISNETTKVICIIAQMAIQLNITYPGNNNLQENAIINVPKNSSATGDCSSPSQSMTIKWEPGHSLQINFFANKTAKNFYISEMSLSVNASVFKNVSENVIWNFLNKSSEFSTPLDMSYKCNKTQSLNLKSNDTMLHVVLSIKDIQLQAFMKNTKPEFGAAQDCDTFDTPDIVPIAVGCALAILVLVVLGAYLIGRKRSQNRGYLSM